MKIVLAMCMMARRTGAEWFVRDLAIALNEAGHSIIVYAPIIGDMVDELHQRCIACVTDLNDIAVAPDVIIGNTRDETVACLAHFPGVPAISVCHDRTAPHGQPPLFSRIRRHVAVDANCAERLSLQHGIPEAEIDIITNGVDLQRFRLRPPLPQRPQQAAIFSNYATDSDTTGTVRAVCDRLGIQLTVIGSGVGRQASSPETLLGGFDLVFAKARCAMEAMAVGCAVVLLNEGMGMAGLVTTENVARWHRWNFGRRLLQAPVEPARLTAEIAAYSASDAAAVSAYMRSEGSLAATAKAFADLAARVVADEARIGRVDPADENREFARHVTDNLQPFGTVPVAVQVGALRAELDQARRENQRLHNVIRDLRAAAVPAAAVPRADAPPAIALECADDGPRVRELENQIAALYTSRSWRVTAPLRWIAARLGF